MQAAVFHHPKRISYEAVPDPRIEQPTDAILRVTATSICGSDLHIYNGLFPQLTPLVLGHEFMGVVEEVGPSVTKLQRGDRVVVPFPIACGRCFFCDGGLPVHCERSNPGKYGPDGGVLTGKGGGLFGYTDLYGGYQGGQAELVRVPYADVGPRKVPAGLRDEEVLFLSDILPTGYSAIRWAQPRGGETVAVFGCGPVGLMAQKCAWLMGASRVFALDREDYRLQRARQIADAEPINISSDDWLMKLREATSGRGVDIAVDAVGMEAHHGLLEKMLNLVHVQLGSINALRMCIDAVRRGGVVSVVGVYGLPYDNFPIGQIFDKGLRLVSGQAPVHSVIDELMERVQQRQLRLDDVISHRISLSEVGRGYEIFNEKQEECVKVVLTP